MSKGHIENLMSKDDNDTLTFFNTKNVKFKMRYKLKHYLSKELTSSYSFTDSMSH